MKYPEDNLSNESFPYVPGAFIRFTRWQRTRLSPEFKQWLHANSLTTRSIAKIASVSSNYVVYTFPCATLSPNAPWSTSVDEADKALEPA